MTFLHKPFHAAVSSHRMNEIIQSTADTKIYPDLESVCEPFDGLLLDAYGVFWGGNALGVFPNCKETMERLVARGKIIGVLSNATQLAPYEIEKLKAHGLMQGTHFHFFITSGTVAKQVFINEDLPFPTPHKKFYLLGMPHPKFLSHQMIFAETLFQETTDLQQADFIYISIPHIDGNDQTDPLLFKNYVENFKDSKLPMVCVNPDRFAHEGNPVRAVVRQGSIAAMHEEQGGHVFYIGKPSRKMYDAAMNSFLSFGISHPQQILMVGDTLETDIRGANNFDMPSALVLKTGMTAHQLVHQNLENSWQDLLKNDVPTFFIEYMGKNGL